MVFLFNKCTVNNQFVASSSAHSLHPPCCWCMYSNYFDATLKHLFWASEYTFLDSHPHVDSNKPSYSHPNVPQIAFCANLWNSWDPTGLWQRLVPQELFTILRASPDDCQLKKALKEFQSSPHMGKKISFAMWIEANLNSSWLNIFPQLAYSSIIPEGENIPKRH